MRRGRATARLAGQRLIAVLLLVSSLLSPIAALLQAATEGFAEVCKCCRHTGTRCSCWHSRKETSRGPSWTAAKNCGDECGQAGGLITCTSFLAPPTALCAPLIPPRITVLGKASPSHRGNPSYFSWRYQRPPPRA